MALDNHADFHTAFNGAWNTILIKLNMHCGIVHISASQKDHMLSDLFYSLPLQVAIMLKQKLCRFSNLNVDKIMPHKKHTCSHGIISSFFSKINVDRTPHLVVDEQDHHAGDGFCSLTEPV